MFALVITVLALQCTTTFILAPSLPRAIPFPWHLVVRLHVGEAVDLLLLVAAIAVSLVTHAPAVGASAWRVRVRKAAALSLPVVVVAHLVGFLRPLGERLEERRLSHPISGVDPAFEALMTLGRVLEVSVVALALVLLVESWRKVGERS